MSFELKLALKYLRTGRRGLVRFTSVAAVTGIAAGVAGLIIAQAISKGFGQEMRDKVLSNTAHITVFAEGKTAAANWQIVKKQTEQIANIRTFEPTAYESAVISSGENSGYAVVRVQNSDRAAGGTKPGVIRISLGRELAQTLGLKIGDRAEVVTFEEENTPQRSTVEIGNIFETGLYEYDSTWIIADEENYLRLKKSERFSPKVFSLTVGDIYQADKTADEIRHRLGGEFRVLDWQEANRPLFAALSLERRAALAVLLLIVLIAALNITTTLTLLVTQRRLDIAILRTCGAKRKNLMMIFLSEGIMLGLTGILAGVMMGLAVCWAGNYFKLISLSKEVYSLNYIPLRVEITDIFLIIFAASLVSLSAIIYPVLKVSGIKPLENLRRQ